MTPLKARTEKKQHTESYPSRKVGPYQLSWGYQKPTYKGHSNNRDSPQFTSGENRPIFLKLTYPFPNLLLKMIFPFQRWDMLVPWRVYTSTI